MKVGYVIGKDGMGIGWIVKYILIKVLRLESLGFVWVLLGKFNVVICRVFEVIKWDKVVCG